VVNFGEAAKTLKIAKKYGAKSSTVSIGRGAVHSRLLEFLGIYDVRKEIVNIIIEDTLSAGAVRGISGDMQFEKPHHGIAFTCPISAFIGGKDNTEENISKIDEVKNGLYKIIYVVVDKGKAEEVIEAASKAGAKGGTIINARGAGVHETQKLFSIEIEPEKEEVFIIAKNEKKDDIIESIKTGLKIDEPGNGIIFVMDINEVYGLHEQQK
jgi:nitrogen regulatory protein PII